MMSEKLLRTFISVTLPKEIVNLSRMLQTTVSSKKDNVKWVNPGNIHLTLKFLGHTPPNAIDKLNEVLSKIVSNYENIKLVVSGTGCFPVPERPRILWLGVDGQLKQLQNMVQNINIELEKDGFLIEDNEYIPHITLARIKYPPKETPDITDYLNTSFEPIKFNISRIRFMSSELYPNGPIYSILGTHFLGNNSEQEN